MEVAITLKVWADSHLPYKQLSLKNNILRKVRNHRNNRASGCFQILICRRCKIIRKLTNQTTGKHSLCHFKASVDNSILELCVFRYSRSVILDISTFTIPDERASIDSNCPFSIVEKLLNTISEKIATFD